MILAHKYESVIEDTDQSRTLCLNVGLANPIKKSVWQFYNLFHEIWISGFPLWLQRDCVGSGHSPWCVHRCSLTSDRWSLTVNHWRSPSCRTVRDGRLKHVLRMQGRRRLETRTPGGQPTSAPHCGHDQNMQNHQSRHEREGTWRGIRQNRDRASSKMATGTLALRANITVPHETWSGALSSMTREHLEDELQTPERTVYDWIPICCRKRLEKAPLPNAVSLDKKKRSNYLHQDGTASTNPSLHNIHHTEHLTKKNALHQILAECGRMRTQFDLASSISWMPLSRGVVNAKKKNMWTSCKPQCTVSDLSVERCGVTGNVWREGRSS